MTTDQLHNRVIEIDRAHCGRLLRLEAALATVIRLLDRVAENLPGLDRVAVTGREWESVRGFCEPPAKE